MTTDTPPLPYSPDAERAIRLVYFPAPKRQGPHYKGDRFVRIDQY